jgi:hypothetical protein
LIASGLSDSAFNKNKRPSVLRSCQLVQQRLGILEIGNVEVLGEPVVNWCEQVMALCAPALLGP